MNSTKECGLAEAQLDLLTKNRTILDEHLKPGDILTHTRCMGCLEEHVFVGRSGMWLCGVPTEDTYRLEHMGGTIEDNRVDDISPLNVTHLNRVPLSCVPFLAIMKQPDTV